MNPADTVIVIRSLVPGGVAQMDGNLVPGDRLMAVNEVNLENGTLDQAVQALKGAPRGTVRIVVAKPLPLPEIGESSTDDVVSYWLSSTCIFETVFICLFNHVHFLWCYKCSFSIRFGIKKSPLPVLVSCFGTRFLVHYDIRKRTAL